MTSDLKKKAVRGAGWLGVGQLASQIMSMTITVLLARLLSPQAFGLVGMVAVFTAFLELFQELGLSSAIIQKKDPTEEQLSTVFYINLACGAALSLITVAASPLIARFYNEPELKRIASLMGLTFFIYSFAHVQGALVRKDLDFGKFVLTRIASRLVGSGLAIYLALKGYGVYALVWQNLCTAALFSATLWAIVGWRPRARPRLKSAGKMIGFGANITGSAFLDYLNKNADYLLVGRFIGAGALGVYTIAYQIMLLPIRRVSSQLSQVAFPTFSAVQDDLPRLRRGYLQMIHLIGLACMPAMIGLLIVAPEAVSVVLGTKWTDVAPVLRILAVPGIIASFSGTVSPLFRSQGRPDIHLRFGLISTPLRLISLSLGLWWGARQGRGVQGVAFGYALSVYLLTPAYIWLGYSLIKLRWRSFFSAVRGPLFATAAMGSAVVSYRAFIMGLTSTGRPLLLWSEIPVGAAVYLSALWLVDREALGLVLDAIAAALGERAKSLCGYLKSNMNLNCREGSSHRDGLTP